MRSESRRIALLIGQDVGFCRDIIRGIRAYAIDKTELGLPERPTRVLRGRRPSANGSRTGLSPNCSPPNSPARCSGCANRWSTPRVPCRGCGSPSSTPITRRWAAWPPSIFWIAATGISASSAATWAHYSKLREASFRLRLAEAGYTVSACYVEYLLRAAALIEWKHAAGRVRRWLERLPKPVAILAANDIPARELADTCRRFGLRVPDDVALLGVDNDDLECGLTSPPLSSVATPARRIGYEAARLLDELMAGKPRAAGADLPAADRRGDPPVDRHVGHPRRGGGGGARLHPRPRGR